MNFYMCKCISICVNAFLYVCKCISISVNGMHFYTYTHMHECISIYIYISVFLHMYIYNAFVYISVSYIYVHVYVLYDLNAFRSCITYMYVIIHICMAYILYIHICRNAWRIYMCGMTHSYARNVAGSGYTWHDLFLGVTPLIHMSNSMRHTCDSCETSHVVTGWRRPIWYLIFIGHFPQKSPVISGSFAKNDLQHKASYGSSPPCTICDTTYSYVWYDSNVMNKSFICMTPLIHMSNSMGRTCGSVIYDSRLSHITLMNKSCGRVKRLIHMCDSTHSY